MKHLVKVLLTALMFVALAAAVFAFMRAPNGSIREACLGKYTRIEIGQAANGQSRAGVASLLGRPDVEEASIWRYRSRIVDDDTGVADRETVIEFNGDVVARVRHLP